jgi:hypothetical protein
MIFSLGERWSTHNRTVISHNKYSSFFSLALLGKLMSIYAGKEGSKRSRRYRKMSTKRYDLNRRDFFTESDK